jgi:hypothetical protein
MGYRTRIYYTDTQKAEMWDRWQKATFPAISGRSQRPKGRTLPKPENPAKARFLRCLQAPSHPDQRQGFG